MANANFVVAFVNWVIGVLRRVPWKKAMPVIKEIVWEIAKALAMLVWRYWQKRYGGVPATAR